MRAEPRFVFFLPSRTTNAVSDIINMVKTATRCSAASIPDRLFAANSWRVIAQKHHDPSEFEATQETRSLLELAVSEPDPLDILLGKLSQEPYKRARGASSDAASLAIQSGDVALAVSLLEQTQSLVLASIVRYRTSVEVVRLASEELAARLSKLSADLAARVLRSEGAKSGRYRDTICTDAGSSQLEGKTD